MIEVELKFAVESIDVLRSDLLNSGATSKSQHTQSDEYLNDPLRDFAKTDQALRIRHCDGSFFLTYKGPNLDPVAKIREEIEIRLVDDASANQLRSAFLNMNFHSVACVKKTREVWSLDWEGESVEICLDEVAEVGGFCELELVVPNDGDAALAKQKLASLAEKLGLQNPIRTSYLEMLLRKRGDI